MNLSHDTKVSQFVFRDTCAARQQLVFEYFLCFGLNINLSQLSQTRIGFHTDPRHAEFHNA